ncbi:hypothetical protein EVAR_50487_1 [Eumeta japonica]|uniref:Uncharacterized protein n=1 Tax=Eumeta variegata TaxID=151549 RepID=A0A4C1XUJ3_EUMVA|nr:hypothetical protein EVAR_50487_1 [Eumeta japonica]
MFFFLSFSLRVEGDKKLMCYPRIRVRGECPTLTDQKTPEATCRIGPFGEELFCIERGTRRVRQTLTKPDAPAAGAQPLKNDAHIPTSV